MGPILDLHALVAAPSLMYFGCIASSRVARKKLVPMKACKEMRSTMPMKEIK